MLLSKLGMAKDSQVTVLLALETKDDDSLATLSHVTFVEIYVNTLRSSGYIGN